MKKDYICNSCLGDLADLPIIFRNISMLPVQSLFHYIPPADNLIMFGKGSKNPRLVELLAQLISQKFAFDCLSPICGVIPIPPKIKNEKDHAYLIARQVSNFFNVPLYEELLIRVDQSSQKTKNIEDRGRLKFTLNGSVPCHAPREGLILLVDDVVTTGATLVAAWTLLGRPPTSALTLASTPRWH